MKILWFQLFIIFLIGCASTISNEPTTPEDIMDAFRLAKSNNDIVKQLKYINEIIKLYPSENSHYIERGIVYLGSGNQFAAINDFSSAIELNPDYYKPYYFRGVAKFNIGQIDEAISDFDKTIEMNEDYFDAYWYLSFISLVNLDIRSSLDLLLKYNKYKPYQHLKYMESLERLMSDKTAFLNNPSDFYTGYDLGVKYQALSMFIGKQNPQYLPRYKKNVRPFIAQLVELTNNEGSKMEKIQYIIDTFQYDYLATPIDDITFDLPFLYREAGVKGTIKINVLIDINGDVKQWEILKGLESKLDNIALEKLKNSKYKPAMLDGKLVESWRIFEYKF